MASRPSSGRPYRSLRSSADFARAYRTGRRCRSGVITVIAVAGASGPATVGFVAGKKIGSAVLRNRAKRRLREAAAHCALRSDTVYVLIADEGVLAADFSDLIRAIDRCIERTTVAEERV